AGRVPFDGESPGEILMRHLTAQPDLSLLPEEYRDVIGRLLEKDPQRRYPSMRALLADLPIPAGSSALGRAAGWRATAEGGSELQVLTVIPAEPARQVSTADYQQLKQETARKQPANEFWARFVRDDPILALFRQLPLWGRILTIVLLVGVYPLLGLLVLY